METANAVGMEQLLKVMRRINRIWNFVVELRKRLKFVIFWIIYPIIL